jgi:hypothetical protein
MRLWRSVAEFLTAMDRDGRSHCHQRTPPPVPMAFGGRGWLIDLGGAA